VGRQLSGLALACLLLGCKTTRAAPENECTGEAPACFEPIKEGCCGDAGPRAECGPKDAPRGTHLKWVCPGKTVAAAACVEYAPACVRGDQTGSPMAAPHAGPDIIGVAPAQDAAPGTVLSDRTEPISAAYAVRTYSVKAAVNAPDPVLSYRDLYFGKDRLGAGPYFLSPAGDSVVYANGTGRNYVHSSKNGKRRDVTPKPYEPPAGATWDAGKRSVTVSFEKHAPMTATVP
jgi:hypothetical protein